MTSSRARTWSVGAVTRPSCWVRFRRTGVPGFRGEFDDSPRKQGLRCCYFHAPSDFYAVISSASASGTRTSECRSAEVTPSAQELFFPIFVSWAEETSAERSRRRVLGAAASPLPAQAVVASSPPPSSSSRAAPWHFLNFSPLPHGQRSLRLTLGCSFFTWGMRGAGRGGGGWL